MDPEGRVVKVFVSWQAALPQALAEILQRVLPECKAWEVVAGCRTFFPFYFS